MCTINSMISSCHNTDIITISSSIEQTPIDSLVTPTMINMLGKIPNVMQQKIMKYNFCYKPLQTFKTSPFLKIKMLSEDSNAMIIQNTLDSLTYYDLGTGCSSTLLKGTRIKESHPYMYQLQQHWLHIMIKRENRTIACNLERTFKIDAAPQKSTELILSDTTSKYLLQLHDNGKIPEIHIDGPFQTIQYDRSEKIWLFKDQQKIMVIDKTPEKIILKLNHIEEALLSTCGTKLFLRYTDKNPELITLQEKVIHKFHYTAIARSFSDDGKYLHLNQYIPKDNWNRECVVETKSGDTCIILQFPDIQLSFQGNFFMIKGCNEEQFFIPLKKLPSLKNSPYSYCEEDLRKSDCTYVFQKFVSLHPNKKFVIIFDSQINKRKVVDIKTGKTIFLLDGVDSYTFSTPSGTMIDIDYFRLDHPTGKSFHTVYALRNDFTILEFLIVRLLQEKKLAPEQVPLLYPELKDAYDSMDKNKISFTSLYQGFSEPLELLIKESLS